EKGDDSETWYYYGNLLRDQKQLNEALVAFQNSANLKANKFVYHNLGITYFDLQRYLEAATWFRKALELEPSQLVSANYLAYAYHKHGDRASAEAAYQHAMRLSPNNQELRNNYQVFLNGN
ncbi:MAG: tetratricopeptide repeat protein, partial [Bacteroidota bacterium]